MQPYIRQGTILEFEQGNEFAYGVVITADCDIVQNKFGKNLAYLPIISHEDFIVLHWKYEQISKELKKICEYLNEIGISDLNGADIRHLLSSVGVVEFIARVKSLTLKSIDINRFEKYRALSEFSDFSSIMSAYFKTEKSIQRGVKEILSGLRSEYFMLPQHERVPYVCGIITLRELQSIPGDRVDSGKRDSAGGMVRSLGCLPDRVRFSIGQCFAYLYARIGLDSAFENDRKACIALVSEFQDA
jgi:hypothetical protein